MNKAKGFTLIEFIFSLVLIGIIAGVIIEILRGPILTYFWASQRTKHVEVAILALDMFDRDLSTVFINSLQLNNEAAKQSLLFKKILSSGYLVNESDEFSPRLLSALPKTLKDNQNYLIYFPQSAENKDKFYEAILKNTDDKITLQFSQKLSLAKNSPQLFYILSNPIEFQCEAKTKNLNRLAENEVALVANQIKHCRFTLNEDKKGPTLFISLEMDSHDKEPIKMTRPILLGEG